MKSFILSISLLSILSQSLIGYSPTQDDLDKWTNQLTKRLENLKKSLAADAPLLKFALSHTRLDGHLFALGTCQAAQELAKDIHRNLQDQSGNYCEIGESLPETPDKAIIHECAKIEAQFRATNTYGTVRGKSPLRFFSTNYDGETFFTNACPCDFYKNLTDEQLKELFLATEAPGWLKFKRSQ